MPNLSRGRSPASVRCTEYSKSCRSPTLNDGILYFDRLITYQFNRNQDDLETFHNEFGTRFNDFNRIDKQELGEDIKCLLFLAALYPMFREQISNADMIMNLAGCSHNKGPPVSFRDTVSLAQNWDAALRMAEDHWARAQVRAEPDRPASSVQMRSSHPDRLCCVHTSSYHTNRDCRSQHVREGKVGKRRRM